MYTIQEAKLKVTTRGGHTLRVEPHRVAVLGKGEVQQQYQQSLAWLDSVLEMGVTAPLAPRLTFPAIGEAGCGFMFTDAARDDDTGHGAFTPSRWSAA